MTDKELNNQKDYNLKLNEAKKLIQDINRLRARLGETPMPKLSDPDAVKQVASLRREYKALTNDLRDLEGTFSSMLEELKATSQEIIKFATGVKSTRRPFNQLRDASRQLRDDELGLIDLEGRRLSQLKENVKTNHQRILDAANEVKQDKDIVEAYNKKLAAEKELQTYSSKTLDNGRKVYRNQQGQFVSQKRIAELEDMRRSAMRDIGDENLALLQYAEDEEGIVGRILKGIEKREAVEREISRLTGLTGALVGGAGALMERLGMRSGIFRDAMRDSSEEMRRMAKSTAEGAEKFNKLQIAARGFGILLKGFAAGLFDVAAFAIKIVDAFFDLNKASVTLQQLTGQNAIGIAGLNDRLATSVKFLETAVELTKEFGLSATNVFNKDVIAGAAEFKIILGLAAEEAAGLAKLTQTNAGSIDAQAESIVDTVSSFNKANRSAINQGQILRDVANTSDDIQASLGNSPALIAKAAAAARRLGMDLAQVDRIASSLMDFESSIQAELEAQLLTGRQINMAKARELALNNDLAGLGKELFNNSVDIHEFGEMNRLEQESMAKALGMSRQELARTAYLRALENGLTQEQAANAANVRLEDMKRLSVQESIQKSIDKIAQAAAPLLQIVAEGVSLLTPILTKVGYLVSWMIRGFADLAIHAGEVGRALMPAENSLKVAGAYITNTLMGFRDFFSDIGSGFSSIASKTKSTINSFITPAVSAFDKIKSSIVKAFSPLDPYLAKVKEITNAFASLIPSTEKSEQALAGIGNILGDLGKIAGISLIGQKLYKGYKARKAPKGTPSDPLSVQIAGGMLGNTGGNMMGNMFKGKMFKGLSKGLGGKDKMAGRAMRGMSAKAMRPGMFKGGKGLLGGLVKGGLGKGILGGLGKGLGKAGLKKIPLLGALFGGVFAIQRLLKGDMLGAGGELASGLASIIPGFGTAASVGIDAALAARDIKNSNQQSPTPMATGGIVTKPTNALVGEAGSEAVIPLREFYAKMDELINVVKQGGDVYMDGNKVGQSMVLASTKLS